MFAPFPMLAPPSPTSSATNSESSTFGPTSFSLKQTVAELTNEIKMGPNPYDDLQKIFSGGVDGVSEMLLNKVKCF